MKVRVSVSSENSSKSPANQLPSCPVVAIGASAGGLEFFQRFFDRMSPTSGMSFVLLQHLDPRYNTLMPELLAKHTAMPIKQAEHGCKLEPNHVYVTPPSALLSFAGCTLQVGPISKKKGDPRLIDHFFRTLAESQQNGAVAIILSGQRIKQEFLDCFNVFTQRKNIPARG